MQPRNSKKFKIKNSRSLGLYVTLNVLFIREITEYFLFILELNDLYINSLQKVVCLQVDLFFFGSSVTVLQRCISAKQ